MDKHISAILLFTISIGANCYIWGQEYSWGRHISGAINDNGAGIAMDNDGNVFVAGTYSNDTLTIGSISISSSAPQAMFIIKYDSHGTVQWAQCGQEGENVGYSVSTDTSGNCYVLGSYYDSVTFGGHTLTSAGDRDIFLIKFNANGDVLWTQSIGGTGSDSASAVSVNLFGEVFISGYYTDSVNFGGIPLTYPGQKVFLAKYDPMGNLIWAHNTDINGTRTSYIAADNFGHCSIAATISSTTSSCCSDVYIANYNETGEMAWSKTLSSEGSVTYDYAKGIAVDSFGDVYLCASFSQPLHWDSIILDCGNNGYGDIFLAKYDAYGNELWARQICGYVLYEGGQTVSVATDTQDNVAITGYFQDEVDFGGVPLTSHGKNDLFVCKYDTNGSLLWAMSNGDSDSDRGNSIASKECRNAAIVGSFRDGITLGPDSLWCASGFDLYVAKIFDSYTADIDNDCRVDLSDFLEFAAAWLSKTDGPQWKQACNISEPEDNVIDIYDLLVFSEQWLQGVE